MLARLPACLPLVLTALISRTAANGEALRTRDDAMESIESRTVNDGGLVTNEHALAVGE